MKYLIRFGIWILVFIAIASAWLWRGAWLPSAETEMASEAASTADPASKPTMLEISSQARKNLGLVSRPVKLEEYWRTVLIPGEVADRPGVSDRGVTSPAVGVVNDIHAYPGDTIRPGEPLFTLQIFSEYLQNTQSELFKATQEIGLVQQQLERLSSAAQSGAVAESRLIELRNQLTRQQTLVQAHRQDLLTRGLSAEQVEQVAGGDFVKHIEIVAPPAQGGETASELDDGEDSQPGEILAGAAAETGLAFEVQDLTIELGQQVQAGQRLAELSNHRSLYIVGHAFKREAAFLEEAVQEKRPIRIAFAEDQGEHWPELKQTFVIRHLSNEIDPKSRTFDFFIPLKNQSRRYVRDGEPLLVWRFRPGQRVRIYVPLERYENVIVLPADAIVREGPEVYVFRQDGDLFKRIPVHVLHEDRQYAAIAHDGSVRLGSYVAQNSAASLNRVLKAQAAGGEQPGLHVHADGTVHAAH